MQMLKNLAIGLSSAILLAACSSTPVANDGSAKPSIRPQPIEPIGSSDPRAVGTVNVTSSDQLNGAGSSMARPSVYFDYDSYILKSEFTPVVSAHSKYLGNNKDAKVVIQGNTDERGGSEYNLALGQKRAEAVRKALILMGASDSQTEAVSFGKEKPKAVGSNEAAWAENRRADIVYSESEPAKAATPAPVSPVADEQKGGAGMAAFAKHTEVEFYGSSVFLEYAERRMIASLRDSLKKARHILLTAYCETRGNERTARQIAVLRANAVSSAISNAGAEVRIRPELKYVTSEAKHMVAIDLTER